MPPLKRPKHPDIVVLPSRTAPVIAETDVLVVGAGPAGIGAAIGAAQAGANVVLTERYGFLGGSATAALVSPFASWHTAEPKPTEPGASKLVPSDHGAGEAVIRGVLGALVERLVKAGGAVAPSMETGYTSPFDPEVFKQVTVDMVDDAGVDLLLHAVATGVIGEDRPQGVVFETKSGPVVVRAGCVVDCSGDADVAAWSGASYDIGREDGLTQPMTLLFRMFDFDHEAFEAYVNEHPGQWFGVYGLWDLIRQAREAGELDLLRDDVLLFASPHPDETVVNATRVNRVLGTDVWDLTYAEWRARRQARGIATFLREYVPGFSNAYIGDSGNTVGVRETRRIHGLYTLTADDVLAARRFDDVIARNTYPLDIHDPLGTGTLLRRLPPGEAYDIPLRTLIPEAVDGLLVAGRCISATHEAMSSVRVMPACVATGQAAGVCGALSACSGRAPRKVEAREVQHELVRQGAELRGVVA